MLSIKINFYFDGGRGGKKKVAIQLNMKDEAVKLYE